MAVIKDGVLIKAEESDIVNGIFIASPEVRIIGPEAFQNMNGLLEVQLPGHVIGIGKHAFASCINLKCVTATNNLLIVGEGAFSNCSLLASFLIDESDNYKEKEPFQCTGSEFIALFGYYEKLSKEYEEVTTAESSISKNSDFDWFGSTDLYEKYPLYSGIYYAAFNGCKELKVLHIPDKMNILGEEFIGVNYLYLIKDLGNIVDFYFDGNSNRCGSSHFLKSFTFNEKVVANKTAIRNKLSNIEIKQIPKKPSLIKSLFKSKKPVVIEAKEPDKNNSNIVLSEEQIVALLEGKIAMLEVIEPDIAKHFKAKLDEICSKEAGPMRRYETSCLYDNFSRVLSIVQTKNIKEIIGKDNLNESVFKKYADILIDSRDNLETLRRLLNNPDLYKKLKASLYLALYEMIKIELINFESNNLYDRMNEIDKMSLLYYFAKDINSDEQLAVASLDKKEPDLEMIKSHLIAQGAKLTYLASTKLKSLKVVRLYVERKATLEKGEQILEPFPTTKL